MWNDSIRCNRLFTLNVLYAYMRAWVSAFFYYKMHVSKHFTQENYSSCFFPQVANTETQFLTLHCVFPYYYIYTSISPEQYFFLFITSLSDLFLSILPLLFYPLKSNEVFKQITHADGDCSLVRCVNHPSYF